MKGEGNRSGRLHRGWADRAVRGCGRRYFTLVALLVSLVHEDGEPGNLLAAPGHARPGGGGDDPLGASGPVSFRRSPSAAEVRATRAPGPLDRVVGRHRANIVTKLGFQDGRT